MKKLKDLTIQQWFFIALFVAMIIFFLGSFNIISFVPFQSAGIQYTSSISFRGIDFKIESSYPTNVKYYEEPTDSAFILETYSSGDLLLRAKREGGVTAPQTLVLTSTNLNINPQTLERLQINSNLLVSSTNAEETGTEVGISLIEKGIPLNSRPLISLLEETSGGTENRFEDLTLQKVDGQFTSTYTNTNTLEVISKEVTLDSEKTYELVLYVYNRNAVRNQLTEIAEISVASIQVQNIIQGTKIPVYRLPDCQLLSILPSQKTTNDFNTLLDCKANQDSGDNEEPKTNFEVFAVIALVVLFVGIVTFILIKKARRKQ